jgi:hypothetical protein
MTIQIATRTFKGISNLNLTRLSDNTVLNWPAPDNFVLDLGIEQRVQFTRDNTGNRVRAGSYKAGENPSLSISYGFIQPEMISFKIGTQFASQTLSTYLPHQVLVNKTSFAAGAVGTLFNGVVADDSKAIASKTVNGLSVALTQADFATFDGSVDDQFALGADGALKFSANLVATQEVVTVSIPADVTGLALSDVVVGAHRLNAKLVDNSNKAFLFEAYSVTPNLEGGSIEFGAENMDIPLFLNSSAGCSSYNLIDTGLTVQSDC